MVVFKDVPILYLPWISFPLSSARQTGLLFPTLGSSSRSGAILSIPWYWNIAPNQDLTLRRQCTRAAASTWAANIGC